MTPEQLERIQKARTLLDRLDAGDDLHKEAAAKIRDLRKELNDEIREGQRNASAAYQEGRWHEREEEGYR